MPEWKGPYWCLMDMGGSRGGRHLKMFRMIQDNEELPFPIPDQASYHLMFESFLHCGLTVRMMNRKFSFRMTAMQF